MNLGHILGCPYIHIRLAGEIFQLLRMLTQISGSTYKICFMELYVRNNAPGTSVLVKKLAKNFMTPLAAYRFINKMYYNKHLNILFCLDTFKSHVHNDQCSSYTLQITMNIYNVLGNELEKIDELKTAIPNISDKNRLRIMLSKVYKLFLNITVQMIKQQFHYDQSVTSMEFEQEMDTILTKVNAYIQRFVTRSDTQSRQERSLIFSATMSVVSGLVQLGNVTKTDDLNKICIEY